MALPSWESFACLEPFKHSLDEFKAHGIRSVFGDIHLRTVVCLVEVTAT